MTDPIGMELLRLCDRIAELEAEVERLRAERDARPEITPLDALRGAVDALDSLRKEDPGAYLRVYESLRAHARKADVCSCSRRLGDYCPTPDPDCKAHARKAVAK